MVRGHRRIRIDFDDDVGQRLQRPHAARERLDDRRAARRRRRHPTEGLDRYPRMLSREAVGQSERVVLRAGVDNDPVDRQPRLRHETLRDTRQILLLVAHRCYHRVTQIGHSIVGSGALERASRM